MFAKLSQFQSNLEDMRTRLVSTTTTATIQPNQTIPNEENRL